MKTMKKSALILFAVFLSATSFGQSNSPGTIQLGLGWGVLVGGATITNKDTSGEFKGDGVGLKANYGLRAQYGLSENLSAGIYVMAEAAVYATTYADDLSGTATDITYSGMGFGLEGKYYLVNKDKFNFSPNVAIGFNTGTGTPDFSGATVVDLSGIAYGIGVGMNWYFAAETFGLSVDLGYAGASLSGTQPASTYSDKVDITVSNGGVAFGLGFTVKFGGN